MKDRKTFVIPLTDKQIKNILIYLGLPSADMEQYKMIYEDMIDMEHYKMIYEDMIDDVKKFEKVVSGLSER